MKKILLLAVSLSVISTSAFADRAAHEEFEFLQSHTNSVPFILQTKEDRQELPENSAPLLFENAEDKKDQKANSTSEASSETQEEESWGTWAYNKVWDTGKFIAENGTRVAMGALAVGYGTPHLVNGAAEVSDWAAKGIVTGLTGCSPLGWFVGKVTKTGVRAVGYYVLPPVAYALGHKAPEIVESAYSVAKTASNTLYNGATSLYNYFYDSSE